MRRKPIGVLIAVVAGIILLGASASTSARNFGAATAKAPSFRPPHKYAVGTGVDGLEVGDLNHDGAADVVASSSQDAPLSVILNTGHGGFLPPRRYLDRPVESVAIADLNGDVNPDLAVATGYDVAILLNRGDGTFADPKPLGLDCCTSGLAAGDVNHDGALDLVTVDFEGGNTASVLINNGDATFKPKVDYGVGARPVDVRLADLNGDRLPEILTASFGVGSISVLRNLGGTFAAAADYPMSRRTTSLAVADLDRDGRLDVATTDYSGSAPGSVVVRLNEGQGVFGARAKYNVGSRAGWVTASDLNGDGATDLTTANFQGYPATLSVLINRGNAHFGARRDYSITGEGLALASADLNGDRRQDLITDSFFGGPAYDPAIAVMLNVTGSSPNCNVPNVRGLALRTAKRAIVRAHCRTGKIQYRQSTIARGHVIAQVPRPRLLLANRGKIDLKVSRGPR